MLLGHIITHSPLRLEESKLKLPMLQEEQLVGVPTQDEQGLWHPTQTPWLPKYPLGHYI